MLNKKFIYKFMTDKQLLKHVQKNVKKMDDNLSTAKFIKLAKDNIAVVNVILKRNYDNEMVIRFADKQINKAINEQKHY